MNSAFVHTENSTALAGLSDFTGVIESSYATVRIVEKRPAGITVQVQTEASFGSFLNKPFACPDAFIAVRDAQSNELLGGSLVITSRWQSCYGSAYIRFQKKPPSDSIILELYEGGTTEFFQEEATLEGVRKGWADFIAKSYPINLHLMQETVDQGGVIQAPEKDTGLFGEAGEVFGGGSTLKWTAILAAGGVGLYLLMPFLPVIKGQFEDLADNFTSEEQKEKKKEKPDPKSFKGLLNRTGNAAKTKADQTLTKLEKASAK